MRFVGRQVNEEPWACMKCGKLTQNDVILSWQFSSPLTSRFFLNLHGASQTTWRYRQGLNRKLQILFGKPAEFLPQVAIDRLETKTADQGNHSFTFHLPLKKSDSIQRKLSFPKRPQNVHTLRLFWGSDKKLPILLGITFLSWQSSQDDHM